ncbi:calcium-binding protein [Zooshikella ganghwensis]|uniref:calcium-binding protein n=1 Tax=Zooshikella ganghwensis TaxID=202772 RepID=UPI0004829763|nr:calcium-binding protein [Zooshikella ganghwensis]
MGYQQKQRESRHSRILASFRTIISNNQNENTVRTALNAAVRSYGINNDFEITDPQSSIILEKILLGGGWGSDNNGGYTHNVPSRNAIAERIENQLNINDIRDTFEFAALSCMYYNSGSLGNDLTAAIQRGDRASAWYEIRYNSNRYSSNGWNRNQANGIAKRRYMESELFGLYNNEPPTTSDALDIYKMLLNPEQYSADFDTFRDKIIAYEQRFGNLSGGSNHRNMIVEGNRDYQVAGTANQITTVQEALQPAKDKLIEGYGPELFDDVDVSDYDIHVLNIVVGDDQGTTIEGTSLATNVDNNSSELSDNLILAFGGNDTVNAKEGNDIVWGGEGNDTLNGEDGNDLLVGEAGIDTLDGGKGEDHLFGDEGNDILKGGDDKDILDGGENADQLEGGQGKDIYHADSEDTINDSGKDGTVFLDGTKLTGGERTEDDPENTYYSTDGKFTYVKNGSTLVINGGLTINNYSDDALGIHLETVEEEEEEPDFDDPEKVTSPIIIDLDGDGVETLSVNDKHYFDHDGNAFAESTGWVSRDDGLLVWDKNNNGVVDSGAELFGNQTTLASGQKAKHGYDALAEFDDNKDGVIDAQDAIYSSLRVWQDKNENGLTDNDELSSLADMGIKSLSTAYEDSNHTDAQGNEHRQTSDVTWNDGHKTDSADVWFKTNTTRRVTTETFNWTHEILALPNSRGYGNLLDLQQAMTQDETLLSMVKAFVAESDYQKRNDMVLAIIYQWAGVTDVDPNSRDPKKVYGHVIDARKLVTLEKVVGRGYLGTWCWGERDPNPHGRAAPILKAEFDKFQRSVTAQLNAQILFDDTILSAYFESGSRYFRLNEEALETYLVSLNRPDKVEELNAAINTLQNLGVYSKRIRNEVSSVLAKIVLNHPSLNEYINHDTVAGDERNNTLRDYNQINITRLWPFNLSKYA